MEGGETKIEWLIREVKINQKVEHKYRNYKMEKGVFFSAI